MPRKLNYGSVRWSRHRKDGVPRKLCCSVRWSRHKKDGVLRKLCGSVRWSRHTGKMACLGNFVAQ